LLLRPTLPGPWRYKSSLRSLRLQLGRQHGTIPIRNAAPTAAYVGNKGNRLYSVRDINQNVYNNDTEGDELSGRPYITKFPYLNYIDMLENYDFSIYYSLQVTLKQQSTNGLFFVAGYTWAHSIDNGSSNRSANVQNSYDIAAERGDSDFDVRNRFTFARHL
jgi:hypothetical protein